MSFCILLCCLLLLSSLLFPVISCSKMGEKNRKLSSSHFKIQNNSALTILCPALFAYLRTALSLQCRKAQVVREWGWGSLCLTQHLWGSLCSRLFSCIISFDSHNHLVRQVLFLSILQMRKQAQKDKRLCPGIFSQLTLNPSSSVFQQLLERNPSQVIQT